MDRVKLLDPLIRHTRANDKSSGRVATPSHTQTITLHANRRIMQPTLGIRLKISTSEVQEQRNVASRNRMKDTLIRFRDGSIGMNNTCSRSTPTSPKLVLLICFSTTQLSGKEHIGIKISRTKDRMQGTTDKLQIDDRSTSVTKGRIRNPEGTTE